MIDAEQGTIDSPLAENQVRLVSGVAEAIARLNADGYRVAVVTNQPASAKNKTTRANLEAVHRRVLELAQSAGGRISSSHVCYHRAEDHCACRKPGTGLLEEAFQKNPGYAPKETWIVGDGITDIQAGQKMGLRTAFAAKQKTDVMRLLDQKNIHPTWWVDHLVDFAARLHDHQPIEEKTI